MKLKYIISILLLIINSIASIASADSHRVTGKIASHYYVLDSWGNNAPNLEIELPDNWEYKKVKGPDFDVHWLTAPADRHR